MGDREVRTSLIIAIDNSTHPTVRRALSLQKTLGSIVRM